MASNPSMADDNAAQPGKDSADTPAARERRTDAVLLKMPNHNMDYPHLAVPTLTAALRKNFFKVKQQDVNVLLRDFLLTEEMLKDLAYRFLPELAKAHIDIPADFDRIRNALVYLHYIDNQIGFARVEQVKQKLQARKYEEVFCDEQESSLASLIFVLTGMLHIVIDLALTYDEAGGEIDNPVTNFLHQKVREVAALNPRVVGFSVIQIQRKATLWFARRLKPLIQGKIAVGGPDASTFKEEYLKNNDCIDYAFLKEAETTFLEFLRGKPVEQLDGVVFRDAEGNIKVNEPRHDIQLSIFRPDFDGYDLDKFLLPTLPLSTSRGCAFAKCTFCNHYKTYSGYYSNDAVKTVDIIELLAKRYNTRFFHFVDDMLEVKEGTAIAEELIRRGLDVNILTYARFEPQFTDEKILELWHKAGIRVIEWGLESASQEVLKKMIKGVSIRQVQNILDISSQKGIVNKLMLFHNYPGETVDQLKMTVDFLRKNVLEKKVRPFFTVRGRLELRLFTPLEITSRDYSKSPFRKRYERSSSFDSLLGYADEDDYPRKVEYIESFINEMSQYLNENKIFSTNDENMSLDLLILDLKRRGLETAVTVQ